MTKIRNSVGAVLAASILIVGLSACEKKEGPAERAGKEIDKTVESAGQQHREGGSGDPGCGEGRQEIGGSGTSTPGPAVAKWSAIALRSPRGSAGAAGEVSGAPIRLTSPEQRDGGPVYVTAQTHSMSERIIRNCGPPLAAKHLGDRSWRGKF